PAPRAEHGGRAPRLDRSLHRVTWTSSHHVRGVVEGDLPGAAEPAEGLDDGALGVAHGVERDDAVRAELGLDLAGRRGRELREELVAEAGAGAGQGLEDLVLGDLVEDGAEVAAVEQLEVFELDEVRQGSPPDRWGRAE